MTLALLCSGQGPQHPAMFAVTGDAPAAAPLFDHAAALLDGHDPRVLVREADEAALHRNRTGQILCTLQGAAALAALPELAHGRRIVLGYSVGEIGAWAAAGLFAPEAALDLAVARAAAMDAASAPGDGLLFVRGLSRDAIDALCRRAGAAVAIVNPGDAFVLGGSAAALAALEDAARAAGATRVVRVGVEVASHTPMLAEASTAFPRGARPRRGGAARARRGAAAQRDRRRACRRRSGRARQAGPSGLDDHPLGPTVSRLPSRRGPAPSSSSGRAGPSPRWRRGPTPICRRAASTTSRPSRACASGSAALGRMTARPRGRALPLTYAKYAPTG